MVLRGNACRCGAMCPESAVVCRSFGTWQLSWQRYPSPLGAPRWPFGSVNGAQEAVQRSLREDFSLARFPGSGIDSMVTSRTTPPAHFLVTRDPPLGAPRIHLSESVSNPNQMRLAATYRTATSNPHLFFAPSLPLLPPKPPSTLFVRSTQPVFTTRMTSTTPSSAPVSSTNFPSLLFSSTFTDHLPRDPESSNVTRQVFNAAYSLVSPTHPSEDDLSKPWKQALDAGQVRSPEQGEPVLEKALIAWSGECATLFDLPNSYPTLEQQNEVIDVLGGFGPLWKGMVPYAMCYGGHQFGNWAGQLGDGRAISLGEYVNDSGSRWEIQLKGAGKTPYSRFADGRAVLRSSVREFLCSEAMHFLGVPTTRALSLVGTGAGIVRDMFYTGSPQLEPGAVVARVAPSFLRLGNFQLATFRQDIELLRKTADYAIEYHYPELKGVDMEYVKFVVEVARRNAKMVAMWQAVGFVHGVMNTDNFSILGMTIDYGPYGYLDAYDPEYTPNTTDLPGRRYKFGGQPDVAHWNILQFCKAMVPLCGQEEMQKVVGNFEKYFSEYYEDVMRKKLGLSKLESGDRDLLREFLDRMTESKADHTNTWRALAKISTMSTEQECKAWCESLSLFTDKETEGLWLQWLEKYKMRLGSESEVALKERVRVMNKANPVYILRNYMAQVAIEKAEKGDYSEVRRLYELLKRPYEEQEGMDEYTARPPTWASRKGVCVNSCSS